MSFKVALIGICIGSTVASFVLNREVRVYGDWKAMQNMKNVGFG